MIMPFMVIYFRDVGFSFFQIAITMVAFSVSMFVFEIPTGAIADSFSRKHSVILGFLIAGISAILIGTSINFTVITLLFIIMGFGTTLISGADDSWVIDNLNHHKKKDLQKEYYIKTQSISALGGIISPIIGALIVQHYSIKPLWFVWGIGGLVGATLLMFVEEKYTPKKIKLSKLFNETKNNTKKGFNYCINHKNTLYITLSGIFISIMLLDYDYWQPFLTDLGMPVHYLGYLASIMMFIMMIIPFTARYLEKYKVKNVMMILVSSRILIFLAIILLKPGVFIIAAGIFLFSSILPALRFPIIEPYFQKTIPKK